MALRVYNSVVFSWSTLSFIGYSDSKRRKILCDGWRPRKHSISRTINIWYMHIPALGTKSYGRRRTLSSPAKEGENRSRGSRIVIAKVYLEVRSPLCPQYVAFVRRHRISKFNVCSAWFISLGPLIPIILGSPQDFVPHPSLNLYLPTSRLA